MWSCWLLGCVIEWATYYIRMLLVLNKALLGKWLWRFSEREIIYVEKSLREKMGRWRRIPVQRRLERSMDRVLEKPWARFILDSRFLWGSSGRSTNFLTENDVGRFFERLIPNFVQPAQRFLDGECWGMENRLRCDWNPKFRMVYGGCGSLFWSCYIQHLSLPTPRMS